MTDYDVVVIGGGVNGLTTAAYLAKAGLSVGVFEARGQCGAHCDTVELGIPGFLHNLHATWLVPSISPAMGDLDLEGLGLELRGTDVLYAKPFLSGRNLLQCTDIGATAESIARVSERDYDTMRKTLGFLAENADEMVKVNQLLNFSPPSTAILDRLTTLVDNFTRNMGIPVSGEDLLAVNGFDLLELLFESEEVRTTRASLAWISGAPPLHRRVSTSMLWAGMVGGMPVHNAKGGSHQLTHALVKAVVTNGGEIFTTCPVERILVEDGRAKGIRLSADALLPGEEITAKAVVSNLTLVPTFLRLLGRNVIGDDWARRISGFVYDDQVLFGVYYSLSSDPEFASAAYDPGVQRAMMGFFGGEDLDQMRRYGAELVSGVLSEQIMGNWFVPTRADPTQAPPGCHTSLLWMDVPPCLRRWGSQQLNGFASWPEIAEPLADAITDRYEQFAPGFKSLILERHVMTPMHQEQNNASAVRGNQSGGSIVPEQYYLNRPLPGVIERGGSRSFVPGLYLSNSIHPAGATWLATGYIAACEVAEDFSCREQPWWTTEPFQWFMEHGDRVPMNLGVGPKWLPDAAPQGADHTEGANQ